MSDERPMWWVPGDPEPAQHKGHRTFVGGFLDGHVDNLAHATPSDFPLFITYPNGAYYERVSLDGGTEAKYEWKRP